MTLEEYYKSKGLVSNIKTIAINYQVNGRGLVKERSLSSKKIVAAREKEGGTLEALRKGISPRVPELRLGISQ
jgi:hypothetical protein